MPDDKDELINTIRDIARRWDPRVHRPIDLAARATDKIEVDVQTDVGGGMKLYLNLNGQTIVRIGKIKTGVVITGVGMFRDGQDSDDLLPSAKMGVICPQHGKQGLTREDYFKQMSNPDARWKCPVCHDEAEWDDSRYEASHK